MESVSIFRNEEGYVGILNVLGDLKTCMGDEYIKNKNEYDILIQTLREISFIEKYKGFFVYKFNLLQDFLDVKYVVKNNLEIKNRSQMLMLAKYLPILDKKEIYDYNFIPKELISYSDEAFVQSLFERNSSDIGPSTLEHITSVLNNLKMKVQAFDKDENNFELIEFIEQSQNFWNNIINCSIKNDAVFDVVKKWLLNQSTVVRDLCFTTQFLADGSYIDKYLESSRRSKYSNNEILFFIFSLSSSNRIVRDRVTKMLSNFFVDNVDKLEEMIYIFTINKMDEYILERLSAICLAVILRINNYDISVKIHNLSVFILKNTRSVSIVRYTEYITLYVNRKYCTSLGYKPKHIEFEKAAVGTFNKLKNENYIIANSISSDGGYAMYGDWGRYAISHYLDSFYIDTEIDYTKLMQEFVENLNKHEREKLHEYEQRSIDDLDVEDIMSIFLDGYERDNLSDLQEFLPKDKAELYSKINKGKRYEKVLTSKEKDDKLAQIILDYCKEHISNPLLNCVGTDNYYDRHYHEIERLGKKYQWVCFDYLVYILYVNYKTKDQYGEKEELKDYNLLESHVDILIDVDDIFFESGNGKITLKDEVLEEHEMDRDEFFDDYSLINDELIEKIIHDDGSLYAPVVLNWNTSGNNLWLYANPVVMDTEQRDVFKKRMTLYDDYENIANNALNIIPDNYNFPVCSQHYAIESLRDSISLITSANTGEREYDFSFEDKYIIYMINNNVFTTSLTYSNGKWYGSDVSIARHVLEEGRVYVKFDNEELKKLCDDNAKDLYYFVTYGKDSIKSEKIINVLYKYDFHTKNLEKVILRYNDLHERSLSCVENF